MIARVFRPSIAERITSSCPGRKSSRPNTRFRVRRRGAILVGRATRATKQPSCRERPVGSRLGHAATLRRMARRPFPPAVWLLGWVSLLTDAASEAIYPPPPLFLTTVLGAGPVALGLIEGAGEGTNSLLRIVSGRLSDRTRAIGRAHV